MKAIFTALCGSPSRCRKKTYKINEPINGTVIIRNTYPATLHVIAPVAKKDQIRKTK